MRRFLIAIACCAGLAPAMAAGPATAQAGPTMLRAALVSVPADAAAAEAPVVVASLKDAAPPDGRSPAPEQEHRPTGTVLLVAGLAIMTGIALRRRGSDQP